MLHCIYKNYTLQINYDRRYDLIYNGPHIIIYKCKVRKYLINKKKFMCIPYDDIQLKSIYKENLILKIPKDSCGKKTIKNEILNLHQLKNNDYVINLIEPNFHNNFRVMLEEYCIGGDLLDYYNGIDYVFTEIEVKIILYQLILAIKNIHKDGLIHCDIKLENIGLLHSGNINHIKLLDFGSSKKISDYNPSNNSNNEWLVTKTYSPPEITYGFPIEPNELIYIDFWEIGIVAYALTYKTFPIKKNDEICFPSDIKITDEMKNFIKSLLQFNVEKRLNLDSMKLNDFFKDIKKYII